MTAQSHSGTANSKTATEAKTTSKSKTGSKSKQPELDINKLINIAFDYLCKKGSLSDEERKKVREEFMKEVMPYAEYHLKKHAVTAVSAGISAAGIKELANEQFSAELVDGAQQIGIWIRQYIKKEIKEDVLISNLTGPGNQNIAKQLFSALKIDEKMGVEDPEAIFKLSYQVMAYMASMAAYKELRKAQEEYAQAQDERILIEQACAESIAMIRQYREEMERVVSTYLTQHLDTLFLPQIWKMQDIVENEGVDYRTYTLDSKKTIAAAVSTACTIKAVLDTPILTTEGELTEASANVTKQIGEKYHFSAECAGSNNDATTVYDAILFGWDRAEPV